MNIAIFLDHILGAASQTGISPDQAFENAAAYGIRGVETDACETPEEARALLLRLQKHGLNVANVDVHLDLVHGVPVTALLDCLHKVEALNCGQLLVIPGFITAGDEPAAAQASVSRHLNQLCALAAARGLTVTIEDYDDAASPCSTLRQVSELLEAVPGLSFTFDTGNFLFNGEDELVAFDRLKSRIRHVHGKDRTFNPSRGGKSLCAVTGRKMYPTAVGSGCLRMRELLTALRATGYDAAITIEHFDSPDQNGDMRRSSAWIREHWD